MSYENYVLAVDIGGTTIKMGVVNKSEVIDITSIRNSFKGNFNELLPVITGIMNNYLNKYHINKIGIGCPGDIENGFLYFASNLGWKNIDVLKEFQKVFPRCEVKVENDGIAACNAERTYGRLKDVDNCVFVTIGKGIGGALILDNKIILGSHKFGGRFGHMVTKSGGRHCNCGRKGCFEAYGSISGLIKTVKEYNLKWTKKEEQIDIDKLSGYKILSYLKENNPVAKEGVKRWHKDIAEGLLNICHMIDPKEIVIAGGVTESELLDIEYIKKKMAKHGYDKCELSLANLKGKTGLVGAASLFK